MFFLIADDNRSVRKMAQTILSASQNTFIECTNGNEAVEKYARYRPDWVIMDIEMDFLDGIAASRKIIRSFPKANIVMLTQYNDPHLKKAALEAGVKAYLLKDDITQLADFFREKNNTVQDVKKKR